MASVGRNVRLLPVRVLGKCGGFDSDIIAGMIWAAGLSVPGVPINPNPARVLNMSLRGDGACTSAYSDAISKVKAAGAIIVVAAGNSTGHAIGTPANCPGVIAVAGLRHLGTKVGFSDLGPEISISAPGGNCINTGASDPCLYPILTTTNSGLTMPVADSDGASIYTDSFNASLGTSFSAPLVSGTVALMLAAQPSFTPAQILAQLQISARSFPTQGSVNSDGTPVLQCVAPQPIGSPQVDQLECYCTTKTCGAGMLDAGAAVLSVSGGTSPRRVTLTEFYHPQFNHYFLTADSTETAYLSAGNLPPVGTDRTEVQRVGRPRHQHHQRMSLLQRVIRPFELSFLHQRSPCMSRAAGRWRVDAGVAERVLYDAVADGSLSRQHYSPLQALQRRCRRSAESPVHNRSEGARGDDHRTLDT